MIDADDGALEPTEEPPVPGSGAPVVPEPPATPETTGAEQPTVPVISTTVVALLNVLSQFPGNTPVAVVGHLMIDGTEYSL